MVEWSEFGAVLFDLDGVITPTADVHELAWGMLFSDFGFTKQDYLTYVDGRPRYDGVRSFLLSRGVDLPEGDPSDPPGDSTVCAMGNRKNIVFNEIIDRDGIEPYPGSIRVLDLLDRLGTPQAIVSSSKNARTVLAAAGMADRFTHIVDGIRVAEEGLAGKPAPDMFLRGAELLGVAVDRCIVIEDAVSGVEAGVAGNFGFVLGIGRGDHAESLRRAGADLVVSDLGETLSESTASSEVGSSTIGPHGTGSMNEDRAT
jgi:beta-phosphoglucomutase family hydrolase